MLEHYEAFTDALNRAPGWIRSPRPHALIAALEQFTLTSEEITELLTTHPRIPDLASLAKQPNLSREHLYQFSRSWHSMTLEPYQDEEDSLRVSNPAAHLAVKMGYRWYYTDGPQAASEQADCLFMKLLSDILDGPVMFREHMVLFLDLDMKERTNPSGTRNSNFKNEELATIATMAMSL